MPEKRNWKGKDIKHSMADITKARKELNFIPKYSLEKGLEEMVKSEVIK